MLQTMQGMHIKGVAKALPTFTATAELVSLKSKKQSHLGHLEVCGIVMLRGVVGCPGDRPGQWQI